MKKFIVCIIMMLCVACASNAQSVVREGNTFTSVSTSKSGSKETKTSYTWKDSRGIEYPIYVGKAGSCFVKKVSKKTGKEYKQYLGAEVSSQICKEMGIKYEPKRSKL